MGIGFLLALAFAGEPNRLTLGAGAVVVRASPQSEQLAAVAIDGSTQTLGVGIAKREPLPLQIVIELPAPTTLERFEFPVFNEFGSARGRHVRSVRLEGSSTSPDAGFATLVEAVLVEGKKEPQRFDVASPRAVRWVRLTAVDRITPAEKDFEPHNFTEVEAYGPQDPLDVAPGTYAGRWRFRRLGLNDEPGQNVIELFQDGTSVQGCQRVGGRIASISGSIEDGLARLTSVDEQGNRVPFTARVIADGQLAGVSFAGPARAFMAAPDPAAETPCTVKPPANPIVQALQSGQTAVVHGIHFDIDSDVLRPSAEAALKQLLDALKADARAVVIEGHTDSDGSDAHNLDLSERRARAVVAWLTARGVDASRLGPVGKGEGQPLADNATSAGRALNRRVEVRIR